MVQYFKNYLKLLKFAKGQIPAFIAASACMGVSTLFDGVSLGMLIPILDRVMTNNKIVIPVGLPQFAVDLVNYLNSLPPIVILKGMAIAILILFFLKGIFFFLQSYFMNVVAQGTIRDVKNILYSKFQDLSLDFYAKKRTGELISRITNDVGFICNAISYGLMDLVLQSMSIILFTIIAFSLRWQLTLIVLTTFPLIIVPVVIIGKRIKKLSYAIQNKMADLNTLLTETIQGAYIVKVFCREKYEMNRFKEINQHYYKANLKSVQRTLFLSPLTEIVGAFGAVIILWVAGKDVIAGKISFGAFSVYMAALLQMIRPFKKLSNVHVINQQAISASQRIYDVLNEKPKVKDISSPIILKGLDHAITFENVFFKYETSEEDVLKNINLEIKRGQIAAFVGHSGAGKSTIAGLVPRLYDPKSGRVLIDGKDIKQLSLHSLRSNIAVVSQEMVLFNATVAENIGYGKDNAGKADIEAAAQKAHAYDFIQNLPKKFDTIIGDRGFRLSGGERQRVSIARAILKDAPILILDEATSNLDSISEKKIQEALYNLLAHKTAFVIAHRLSTIQRADIIVVMDKGIIAETGTHQELIVKNSLYKHLHDLQFSAQL